MSTVETRRAQTTEGMQTVQANYDGVQIPNRSYTETPSALRRLGLNGQFRRSDEDKDGLITNILPPSVKRTQREQDQEDEKARKQAMGNLVNSWQERLQLISVITTFFASIEAGILVPLNTDPNRDEASKYLINAANAGLLGALIMHVYAAVLSFLAAFLLIRYKLKEASREEFFTEKRAEGFRLVASPVSGSLRVKDVERDARDLDTQKPEPEESSQTDTSDIKDMSYAQHNTPAPKHMESTHTEPPIFTKDPHLEQVGFWSFAISSHMLSRVHTLCIVLAGIGFLLAILGIILYAWALQPKVVSIFMTACLGAAILAMVGVLFVPDP